MKKYITLCGLFAVCFLGIQSITAQNNALTKKENAELASVAKMQTHDLHKKMELTGDQQGNMFKVLTDYNQNKEAVLRNKTLSPSLREQALLELDKRKEEGLRNTLSEEQYKVYLLSEEEAVKARKNAELKRKQ